MIYLPSACSTFCTLRHAAPLTPLESPCAARTTVVLTPSEKACCPINSGSPSYIELMFEMPPPNTMTSGSTTFTSAPKLRASRCLYTASDRTAEGSPATSAAAICSAGTSFLGERKILSRQARPRKEGFYAAVFSAVTPVTRALVFGGPWQRIMSPLSADAIKSG
jgi:hypothetical protein